jgi:hypothetical protein
LKLPHVNPLKPDALPLSVEEATRVPLGTYRGLRFGVNLHLQFPPSVFLEGAIARQSGLSREHQGPRAVLNALERVAGGYESECDRIRQDLAIAESQLRDYQARLGKPFVHERYLSELTGLRDRLKSGLSAKAQAQGDEAKPTVSELAERIKTLKAAHSIEATPQRVRHKQSAAEEPVTARIRRRTEVAQGSESRAQLDADASGAGASAPLESALSVKQPMTFQERVVIDRRQGNNPERML